MSRDEQFSSRAAPTTPEAAALMATRVTSGEGHPRRRRGLNGVVVVLLILMGVAVPGGIAYAWYSGSGSGHGTVTATTLQPVLVSNDTAEATTDLLPGHTGDVTFKVDNPNAVAVTLVSVVRSDAITSDTAGCPGTDTDLVFSDQTSLAVTVAANAVDQVVSLPGTISMAVDAPNACQGANIAVPITITVRTP